MKTKSPSVAPGIRKHIFRNLFLLVFVLAGLVFAVTTISARKSVRDLADNAIEMTEQRTDSLLYGFFGPIEHNLHILEEWQLDEVFEQLENPLPLNRRFAPFLTEYPQVTSMLIANDKGEELLLLWDGTHWKNRVTRVEEWGQTTRWWRWSKDFELLEQWEKTIDYDPRQRPWFQGAIRHLGSDEPHWTEPYTFFTTKDPYSCSRINVDDQ